MTPEQEKALARLRDLWPDKAAQIEKQLAALDPAFASSLKIKMNINYTLEKFEGEYSPGKTPVEVIRGMDSIGEAS